MSLPPELRVLCHQLSSTPSTGLPQITPVLLRNVLRSQAALSLDASPAAKSSSSECSVLVHKLKTQISTLLQGKSVEGRYTAVALIKAVVDVGGWEMLRGLNSWVTGLLAILGKPDPVATKELCILSLTSIYLKVHQYQTLVREIATPTLPNFVTSCLDQLNSASTRRERNTASPLRESVLGSFSLLVNQYPTIFRPYNKQIRTELRGYLAPTICDGQLVTKSLARSARHLAVLMYQTAAKNGSGEEWARGVQDLIKKIHSTVDQVYRAVIEDWEPLGSHVSQSVDMDQEIHGGSKSEEDLPVWTGIDAGLERLVGLLGLLGDHFRFQTVAAITVPLGSIAGLWTRLMSVVPPSNMKQRPEHSGTRLHPAVVRTERERLWAGLPAVYIASMEMYLSLAQRLHHNFTSMAQPCLTQAAWTFSHIPHDEDFRAAMYQLVLEVLPLCGSSFEKSSVAFMSPMIMACCRDIRDVDDDSLMLKEGVRNGSMSKSVVNVDTFLINNRSETNIAKRRYTATVDAANRLLPFFLTHLPQQHLQGYLRVEIDRTSILSHHREAMLASVLYPFIGKNGKSLPSIIPHLCREASGNAAVEALLRPRQPVVQLIQTLLDDQPSVNGREEDEDMMEDVVVADDFTVTQAVNISGSHSKEELMIVPRSLETLPTDLEAVPIDLETVPRDRDTVPRNDENVLMNNETAQPVQIAEVDEEHSDESVHLTMELSDSDDESLS